MGLSFADDVARRVDAGFRASATTPSSGGFTPGSVRLRLPRRPAGSRRVPPRSAAGQFLELLERLSIEQRPARHFARATRLGADCAMTVMLGVPGALLGADRALPHAGLQQPVNDDVVRLGRPGQDPRHEVAQISAIYAERDARAHVRHVVFHEIRVRARRARLGTAQTGVDRRGDLSHSERHASRRSVQHLARLCHATRPARGSQRGGAPAVTGLVKRRRGAAQSPSGPVDPSYRSGSAGETSSASALGRSTADRRIELELKRRRLERLVRRSRSSAFGPVRDHVMGPARAVADAPIERLDR